MNTKDARNEQRLASLVTDQKISVNTKEPEGSYKARVNPRTKTNAKMKDDG